jgi:holo-[acyl-carrier-protein] synthase
MILGIGNDIIDIRRIEASLERFGDRFIRRVFTEMEQARTSRREDRCQAYGSGVEFLCQKAVQGISIQEERTVMKISIYGTAFLMVAALAVANVPVNAQAQGSCQGTCSNAEATCKRTGTDAKDCADARKQCMQTGVFTNPRTGRTFTNICKN